MSVPVSFDPFTEGQLPSSFPEAQPLAAVRILLAEQVDMQFADLRALLRLPRDDIAPSVGCNFTAAAMIMNQISGFSIWFFHNRYAQQLIREEQRRRYPLSGRRFLGFVRAYYPRMIGEPQPPTIARRLYEIRNLLSHNLGIADLDGISRRNREVILAKPDPPLSPSDVVELERCSHFPLAGIPVQRVGTAMKLYLPGMYWALGKMLRAALVAEPMRCERQAEKFLQALPVPRAAS